MTEPPSKFRLQAERAFAEAQSQFLARDRRDSPGDPAAQARAEKTLRLKEARLAKETEQFKKDASVVVASRRIPKRRPQS